MPLLITTCNLANYRRRADARCVDDIHRVDTAARRGVDAQRHWRLEEPASPSKMEEGGDCVDVVEI
jgi:hypothetical protein